MHVIFVKFSHFEAAFRVDLKEEKSLVTEMNSIIEALLKELKEKNKSLNKEKITIEINPINLHY